jgi:hypothetical protein
MAFFATFPMVESYATRAPIFTTSGLLTSPAFGAAIHPGKYMYRLSTTKGTNFQSISESTESVYLKLDTVLY